MGLLVVRRIRMAHCKRGPERCEHCRAAAEKPALPKLLDVCPYGDAARPTTEVERAGTKSARPYDVLQVFADATEARAFAQKHGVTDVLLR